MCVILPRRHPFFKRDIPTRPSIHAKASAAKRLRSNALASSERSLFTRLDRTGLRRKHLSDRQLVGYYWTLGRIATVFQIDLDVAQGTEVYVVGLELAARKNRSSIVDSTACFPHEFLQDVLNHPVVSPGAPSCQHPEIFRYSERSERRRCKGRRLLFSAEYLQNLACDPLA